jgi:hypothetical protein
MSQARELRQQAFDVGLLDHDRVVSDHLRGYHRDSSQPLKMPTGSNDELGVSQESKSRDYREGQDSVRLRRGIVSGI